MIRTATPKDVNKIMEIYKNAKIFMAQNGNPDQWSGDYPMVELVSDDIENGNVYVLEKNGGIYGVFAFIIGVEPTYINIKGQWKSENKYGTIHRLASNGLEKGVFKETLNFCLKKCPHIRIDTHEKNLIMRRLVENNGFSECGTIIVEDDTPRIAFEYCI